MIKKWTVNPHTAVSTRGRVREGRLPGVRHYRIRYPACNAHGPYCHLWPAPLYNIFPHYLINVRFVEKIVTVHKMCVLIFCTNFVWNISYNKKKWARYEKKNCRLVFMQITLYSFSVLMKLALFRQIFEKILKYQISWKSVQLFQADRRTDMTKLIVTFRNFANAPETG